MLRAENVTVRYGAQTVVNGLSFELRAGQWLMLVGPNGAGKSTLIEAIAQGVPYTGRISLEGRDIRALKGAERARSVGFLAQKNAVSYAYSVEEVVSLGRYAHASGFLSARDDEGEACVERALEWTGLTALRRASVLTLSGGDTLSEVNAGVVRRGTLTGSVWIDRNGDCVRQAEEELLSGVEVHLMDGAGRFITESTTTDENGRFAFARVAPGSYKLRANEDYMPFIHSLQQGEENTRTGYLNVSVLGGNTANTEFEFLTGNTIGFLPQGSVAYQQYVQKETPSLASYLKELDYHTVAIHPYYASGWDRDRVYPLLGFDEFLSQEDFTNPKRIRNYISDESSFAKIIELYENKKEGEPLFVFNVTMQNHSGYEEEFHNFTPDITVDGIDSKALSMYLSLVKQTDHALQGLIDYFSQADEDTMIVFFGDHQPTTYVSNPILRNNKVNPETLTDEENLLKYKVPYVIWSNFDIEEQTGGETSANYLAMDVLENCDLPLPALQSSLTGLRKEYPVISAAGVREADGTLTTVKECGEALNDYRSLEYYLLFDYER